MESAAITAKKNTDKDTGLVRKLGPVSATAIVVANMIGAGIFTTSGIMAAELPSAGWVIFCWVFGGAIALSGALCYAELATRMPQAGGEYLYLKRLYHPALGFLTGWTSFFVGFSVPIAASALGFSEYLFAGLSTRLTDITPITLLLYKKSIAVLIIVIFTVIHYLGLKVGSIVQNSLTVVKIFIVLGLASVGLILGGGNWSYLSSGVSQPLNLWSLGTAMMLVGFSYSGWNASAYIAGELRNPRKTLPISLLAGTGIVIFIFLMVNVFIFQSAQYSELQNTIAVVKTAAVGSFGNWIGENLSFLIAIGLLSSLSAFIILGPRVYYAMAQDRLFFPFAAKVHRRYMVPAASIVIQGTIAVLMVVIGSFEQLLIYIGFALGIFPWLAVIGVFIARKHKIGEETAFKVWGYPLVPVFFLFCSLVLMIFNYINRPLESTAAVVTVLAGIPCYYLWVRSVNKADNKK